MRDLQAVECGGQPADRHRNAIHFEPGRFHMARIANSSPRLAHEARDAGLEVRPVWDGVNMVSQVWRFHADPPGSNPNNCRAHSWEMHCGCHKPTFSATIS